MIKRVDLTLDNLGATRIGQVGLGDDGKGTLEDDFAEWKDKTIIDIASCFRLQEREFRFEPKFIVEESTAIAMCRNSPAPPSYHASFRKFAP